jgi:alkanesulfonate monooxygenase
MDSIKLHWYLPTHGDGRTLTQAGAAPQALYQGANADSAGAERLARAGADRSPAPAGARAATMPYMQEVARAAESSGFEAVLTPTGTWCEEAWITCASLIAITQKLKFLVAFRPGIIAPGLAAQQAATFQRLSGGRLMLNVVTGAENSEQRRFGDDLDKDARYARTDEFLTIFRGAWNEPFDFQGEHLWAEGAFAPGVEAPPPIYFGGSSDAALAVAAKHAEVYLSWGEPPQQIASHFERVGNLAAEGGRTLRYGARMHTIARPTAEEAWRAADALLADADPEAIKAVQEGLQKSNATSQRRMAELHGGSLDNLEIYPNVWAGVGLLRAGAGTALVGSYEEVAERIAEYVEVGGVDEFILSGYPHVEEAYWFAEGVMPLLRERGLLAAAAPLAGAPTPDEVPVAG